MTPLRFIAALRRHGFVELGGGLYSTVLGKPGSDRVIKVGRGAPDGWVDYVMWADQAGYGGTFAPKVYSLHIYKDWYVASMERLDAVMRNVTCPGKLRVWEEMAVAINGYCPPDVTTLNERAPGALKFCMALKAANIGAFDLHGGNFMLRGKTVVCTDPVSGNSTSDVRRWRTGSKRSEPEYATLMEAAARAKAAMRTHPRPFPTNF